MQQCDEAQQNRQGDVLELTCNGMVSCAYSMVILGHSVPVTPASIGDFISSCIDASLVVLYAFHSLPGQHAHGPLHLLTKEIFWTWGTHSSLY